MKRFFGNQTNLLVNKSGTAVTLGMFDGVHLGHKAVIEKTVQTAKKNNLESVVITFDIHPQEIISHAPDMICSLEHRLNLIERLGADVVWVLSFNMDLARLGAEEFSNQFLIDKLNTKYFFLGESGNFGKGGLGNIQFLKKNFPQIESEIIPRVIIDSTAVSSSAVRNYVKKGEIQKAKMLLGRLPSVLGNVTKGRQIGKTIGFPTLNIDPHHELHPPHGVYTTTTLCGNTSINSITNIGHRPTIDPSNTDDVLIETHLFDFSANLYNQIVEVSFIEKIRDEQKFSSLEDLTRQIKADCQIAKKTHASTSTY